MATESLTWLRGNLNISDHTNHSHRDSGKETLNQIYLELQYLLRCEAPGVALSAVVYPGLDVFAGVQFSLLKVVSQGQPGRAVPATVRRLERGERAINPLRWMGNSCFTKWILHKFFVNLVEVLNTAVLVILKCLDEGPRRQKSEYCLFGDGVSHHVWYISVVQMRNMEMWRVLFIFPNLYLLNKPSTHFLLSVVSRVPPELPNCFLIPPINSVKAILVLLQKHMDCTQ